MAKFLERKMQDPNGLASMDPKLVELAVKNAKDTLATGNDNAQLHPFYCFTKMYRYFGFRLKLL